MWRNAARSDHPVLILTPFGRDAESAARLLADHLRPSIICHDLVDLAARIDEHAGTVLIAEEALQRVDLAPLVAALDAQPSWSDIPFVYLAAQRQGLPARHEAPRLPERITNTMVLDRPLSSGSLMSALEWALGSRRRQYLIRDQVQKLEEQAHLLAETATELRESEARFRAITESSPQIVWSARADGFHDYMNQRFFDYTGIEKPEGLHFSHTRLVHDDDREMARSTWRHCVETGEPFEVEYRMLRHDGVYRWHLGQAMPVHDADGHVTRWFGTCTDIDDQVTARESLSAFNDILERQVDERTAALHAEMAERQRIESALRQSQKMEAIGQLTGGIAHDFNNFLTGIIGSIDIVKRRIASGRLDDIERFMNAASTSAQRASSLTHRLLAFARRQTLDPHPTDVNKLVESMHEIVMRSLNERITLQTRLSPDLSLARVDPSQVESALLNMVINARDAMPDGGALTIATDMADLDEAFAARYENLKAGRYVVISVRDNGIGMSEETLARALDPFFTTKPLGQGTGLGLSMIYGFARQSNGHLQIDSKPGRGTVVKLYLPPAAQADVVASAPLPLDVPEGRGEAILVVEDDPAVRTLVLEVLQELGYEGLEAEDARSAFPILDSDRTIDLLISDVGLPGMNGRQLADIARLRRTSLKVLFITGYAENESVRSGGLGPGMAVIAKPFAIDVLANRIKEMMDPRSARRGAPAAGGERHA